MSAIFIILALALFFPIASLIADFINLFLW